MDPKWKYYTVKNGETNDKLICSWKQSEVGEKHKFTDGSVTVVDCCKEPLIETFSKHVT